MAERPAPSRPGPRPEESERRKDAAFVLPLVGLLLLLPPLLNLFTRETLIFGLPLEAVYLFVIWLTLVIGAFLLSRRASPPNSDAD